MTDKDVEQEIVIDRTLILEIIKKRRRVLLLAPIAVFIAFFLYQTLFMDQKYVATTSLIMQQSQGAVSSALGMLTGSGGPGKRVIGIVSSRQLADDVERQLHLQDRLQIKTRKKTLEYLQSIVKAEDSTTDGLLYINVTIKGPALFIPGEDDKRTKAKQLASEIANAYVRALRTFYISNDNERDSVLLREAEKEAKKANSDYETARLQLKDFLNRLRSHDSRSLPPSGESTPSSTSDLMALYQALYKAQADIKSLSASQQTEETLTSQQLRNLKQLPTEDPLLTDARNYRDNLALRLSGLEIQYGPDNPRVVSLQKELLVAEKRLRQQEESIRNKRTTPQIRVETELQGLVARETALQDQIRTAEGRLPLRRELMENFDRLKTELTIRLEVRKTTESEWAKLRLGAVSAQNRISVVDTSIPPDQGNPNLLRILMISIAAAIFVSGAWFIAEYAIITLRRSSVAQRTPPAEKPAT